MPADTTMIFEALFGVISGLASVIAFLYRANSKQLEDRIDRLEKREDKHTEILDAIGDAVAQQARTGVAQDESLKRIVEYVRERQIKDQWFEQRGGPPP